MLFISLEAKAQNPIAHFSFDDCMPTDQTGNYINNIVNGAPQCVCGPEGMALQFDGSNDFIQLDDEIKDILVNDFTMSFYFWVDPAIEKYNMFAIKKPDCIDIDSTMHIAYDPGTNLVEFNFTRNIGDRISIFEPIDPTVCWHHVAVTKSGTDYSFYLDRRFISTENFGTNYEMSDSASVYLANTECLSSTEQLMPGRIDELKFFDVVLNSVELDQLVMEIDQINTADQTIFSGESVNIQAGPTCAPNFFWSSTLGFDNPSSLTPIATPDQTQMYILSFDYGSCVTQDSIRINVLDSGDRDCENLLLPKAFTPNNDGLNDTYGISNSFLIDELIFFEIYDRWGTKIFETNQLNLKWDGTLKGVPVNATAFVYKVKYICSNEEHLAVGNFSILR